MEEVRDEPGPHSSLTERIDDDDDQPTLSAQALEALREFFREQNRAPVADDDTSSSEVALLAEDWRLSQFWYDRDTAETVAREVLSLCCSVESPSVACIACPTLYAYLKKIDPSVSAQLLEYDKRFEQYGSEFTFYDYNQPEELPSSLKNAYQIVVADPPYLSKECLEMVTQTISFLMRPGKSYLLLLTGEVQKDRAAELLDLYPCGFRPQHSSKLGNEFLLFTNYDPGMRLGGWERDQ
ncbi:uncharacterized protein LOC131318517 [Rhododendron vialii]|uniref:uncharacterized protein LOC131318517 n=1 Tax=Rhododendron vialii TaxID=182163 RepID=UPI002660073B|nr:uncharacterized protein LOC131318517 [Rhododendron vialii]XP_058204332.1 uncharacterized protein LOC131318517 [Rhododendron vialii]XP_058204333.1 uncharacterized protein LOC131318517 [Rhododendron vialii]